ncbi:MAG: hypothetical protein IPL33_20530 [Sphingobacteriales bacterium]|nr:hypothetical protein [Sphingobacteriales bacterium]
MDLRVGEISKLNKMTKVQVFGALFLMCCLFACNEQEELLPEQAVKPTISQKMGESEANYCKTYRAFKTEFCPRNDRGTYETPLMRNGIIVSNTQGLSYQVVPFKNQLGQTDFIVQLPNEQEYVLTNTSYWYYRSFSDSLQADNALQGLYLIKHLIENKNTNISAYAGQLQQKATLHEQDETLYIRYTDVISIDETLAGSLFFVSRCVYEQAETVRRYINNIGFADNSTYEYIVESALESCGFDCYTCADPICVFDAIFAAINPDNFTDQEKVQLSFLVYSSGLGETETAYLSDNPILTARYYDFFISSLSSENCEAGQVFCRLNDWLFAIKDDPLALLRDCMENDPNNALYVDDWINLATFNANDVPEVSAKLADLGDEYWIQTLYNATNWDFGHEATAAVNMDFFGVRITQMPLNILLQPMTPEEFLESIRVAWATESVLGQGTECYQPFPPYGGYFRYNVGYEEEEEMLWLSEFPKSTIFSIKMADDGSVIVSDYASCCWTFSTLNAPGWFEADSYDGYHPVSGNRRFGLRDNGDGSYTFFTQGVDKLTGVWHALANTTIIDAFSKADELWTCMLGQIATIVTDNGGSIDSDYEIMTYRPEWELLRQYLYENCGEPINIFSLPCTNE